MFTSLAENSRQIADQVNVDSLDLWNDSLFVSQNGLRLPLLFWVVGAVVLGVSLLVIRRRFKSSFTEKLLGMTTEVLENNP
jgi:hypothetical protein